MTHRKKKPLLIIVVIMAGAAALLAAATWQGRQQHAGYTRYVSPILRGGTRFTFLYPDRLTVEEQRYGSMTGSAGPLPDWGILHLTRPETAWHRWQRRVPIAGRWATRDGESVRVRVFDPSSDPMYRDKVGWQGRTDVGNESSSLWSHVVRLGDTRSRLFFMLGYGTQRGAGVFDAHDKTVTDSFQVLPAGAPIPR